MARAGPSEALTKLRRALVELSPDVRGDDVDRYGVVGPWNNLSANHISLGGPCVTRIPEAYVRCWRSEMSAERSGHTQASRNVDTCTASGEWAVNEIGGCDILLEDPVHTPSTLGNIALDAAGEHEV